MQIDFLDKLDAFLKLQVGDEWNYTFTAEEKSLQIQLNVWIDPQLHHLRDVPKDKLEVLKELHGPKQYHIGETNEKND